VLKGENLAPAESTISTILSTLVLKTLQARNIFSRIRQATCSSRLHIFDRIKITVIQYKLGCLR